MMNLEKTWNDPDVNRPHFAASNSIADQSREFLWYTMALLTGIVGGGTVGLWTVVSSSDAVTAGAGNKWGVAYDGTKLVRAAAGTAHSWMVLQGPLVTAGALAGVPFYLIIDWSGASDQTCNFYLCKNAPTGGTITARPTSTDETVALNFSLNAGTVNTPKMSGFLASDGTFWILATPPGSGMIQVFLAGVVLGDVRANDQFPMVLGGSFGNSGGAALANLNSFLTRRFDDSIAVNASMGWSQASGGTVNPPANVPNTGDQGDNSFYTLLTDCWITTAAQQSRKGRFQDIVIMAPSQNIQGDTFPLTGSPTDQALGWLHFPINGTPVTL